MSTNTARAQLHKPDPTETVSVVQDLNNNYDKIDTDLGFRVVTSGTRPSAPYQGQTIYETDTKLLRFWNGTKWFDVNERYVRKTADESVTSSTAYQNDDALVLPLAANDHYRFELFLRYEAAAAADIKAQFTGPAGFSLKGVIHRLSSGGAATTDDLIDDFTEASGPAIGGIGAGTALACTITGIVLTAATAGNLQVQWAQVTSNATPTKVLIGSYLMLKQVA